MRIRILMRHNPRAKREGTLYRNEVPEGQNPVGSTPPAGAGVPQAPVPPPPVITPENWQKAMTEQFTQAHENYNRAQSLEAKLAQLEKDYAAKLAEYTGKVEAYDSTAANLAKYSEFGKAALKAKFEALEKEFVEDHGFKLEDLEKDPLASIQMLDDKLKIYNNLKEAIAKRHPPADGTNGQPEGNQQGITYKSYSDVRKEIFRRQTHKGE